LFPWGTSDLYIPIDTTLHNICLQQSNRYRH
jgi:hypothetical protein